MALFKNKYRIEPARLKNWDYSSPGLYFVTICTKGRECYFGEIVNGKMNRNEIGNIVAEEWERTPQIRKYVELDEWVLMPNHLHGIIIINESIVETHCNASLQGPKQNIFGPQKNNLPSIIRGFKSITTKRIHAAGYPDFAWQPRYYDHIIRNDDALKNIRNYIQNNPPMWEYEKNHNEDFVNWI